MDLLYLLRVLFKRKWLLLILSAVAGILTFLFVFLKKDNYESVAQYSTGFTEEKIRLADGTTAVDLFTADSKFNNVIETFRSPRVIGMLSYKLLLHDLSSSPAIAFRRKGEDEIKKISDKLTADSVKEVLRTKIEKSQLISTTNVAEKDIYEILKLYKYDYTSLNKNLSISRVARTDYLNIVFTSENAELSAYVVNTLGAEFLNYYQTLNSERSQINAGNIQALISQQQLKIDSLNFLLRREKVSQGAIDPITMSKTALETVTGLESDLATATSEYNTHKYLYDSYKEQLDGLLIASGQGNNAQSIINLKTRRDNLAAENARLSVPDPDIQRQINDLDNQIRQLSSSSVTNAKSKEKLTDLQSKVSEEKALMDGAKSTMENLNKRIGYYNGKSNISPGSIVDISAIESQLKIENDQLATLKERYNQAEGLVRDDPTANFKQTLVGQPSVEPVPKNKILKTGLAGVVTFSLLSLFIVFGELFDSRIKTPGQFQKIVSTNVLGVVNYVNFKKNHVDRIMVEEQDISGNTRESLFKNSIRKLRYELNTLGRKVILLTSSTNGAGKSVIAEALAFSYLLSNKKVLLIDFNFFTNTITESFLPEVTIEKFKDNGFFNNADLNSMKKLATAFNNLYVIGCHTTASTPSEAIDLEKFATFINNMKDEFDMIFIEGAAINERSDSNELLNLSDGVIFVFSADKGIGSSDLKSFRDISTLKDKYIGSVLNKVQIENLDF